MLTHLLPTINQAYDLPLQNLRYLQRGWGGDCYTAVTPAGERYFLKFHDPTETLALAASCRDFYLPLTYQLHKKDILPHIPHPIPTVDGRLSHQINPYTLVMTNYIEGKLIGFDPFPAVLLEELAKMVATLHNCLDRLEFEHPFEDDFKISFEPILNQYLTGKGPLVAANSRGIRTMDESLQPRAAEIEDALNHLQELQSYAQSAGRTMVVCHTDIHGGNLMRGLDGRLYLLDWENAMIAPPEHDLIFFAGEPGFSETFFPTYRKYYPSASIDRRMLEFYFYRRALEDLADFILRIYSGSGTPERDQEDLQESIDIVDNLPGIEETVRGIKKEFCE